MDDSQTRQDRRGGIDPAALAAATLSAAISVISPPGPYSPGGALIGLAVLAVIIGFDHEPVRHEGESIAYSAVIALIAWLVIAYPIEIICSGIYGIGELSGGDAMRARLAVLFQENALSERHQINELGHSTIPPILHIGLWATLFAVMYPLDRCRSRTNEARQRMREDVGSPKADAQPGNAPNRQQTKPTVAGR